MLIYGNGRSYGDVCLNDKGLVLLARGLDRFICFDRASGVIRAEAGVLLSEILEVCVPLGWFLAVTPGTQSVTLGGAVANDVHGKNHHHAGTFGCHVRALELLRSDGERRICTSTDNADWFAATVGGLGLTGLITWVEIQLQRIDQPWIQAENRRFADLADFYDLAQDSDERFEFTVAWLDCAARGRKLGRGVFTRGNFSPSSIDGKKPPPGRRLFTVPFTPPVSLVNNLSVRAFNALYARRQQKHFVSHYKSFFYPLDSIGHWNRIYGSRGFLQYQCVLPPATEKQATRELLDRIARSRQGSFLAVAKRFGERVSPGLLSFPRPGMNLALDFPMKGRKTLSLLNELDQVVVEAGGALYPAKDARMSGAVFRHSFPHLNAFSQYIDPQIESQFWRRVSSE